MEITPQQVGTPVLQKTSHLSLLINILLIIVIIGGLLGGYFYFDLLKTQMADTRATVENLNAEKTALVQKISQLEEAACKGTWSATEGCVENIPALTFPKGGEEFCFGDEIEITWNKDMISSDVVEILLKTPRTTGILDAVPTSAGKYVWSITPVYWRTDRSFNIPEDDVYSIYLQTQGSALKGNQSGVFSIANCN